MTETFQFGTGALASEESQAQAFFRILTHDDRSSFYCIARRGSDGKWSESYARTDQLLQYSLFDQADWYVTRNGFNQRSRKSERLRQINAFMFDLDCHQGDARAAVSLGVNALKSCVEQGKLPEPSLVVDTGRGLHVYYVLDHSLSYRVTGGSFNEKGLRYFRDIEGKLLEGIKASLRHIPQLEADTAVFDYSRVSRIPGTYNVAAKRYAELIHVNEKYYSLTQLSAFNELSNAKKPNVFPGKTSFINFDKLSLSRVSKIFKLQEIRHFDCKGNRELMCFCLYNAAVQVYADKDEAFSRLVEFNTNFQQPLAMPVLHEIVRSVSKVGFYKMSAATMVSKLGLSSSEIEATAFFESRRMIERQQAKRLTAEKRKARNEKICALYAQPGATMDSVAQTIGVCKRTVASVLKAAREALQCAKTPVQPASMDLREAARAALNFFAAKECNFLAHDFMCVPFGSPSCRDAGIGFGFPSLYLDTGT